MKDVVKTFTLSSLMVLSGIFACGTLEAMAAGGISYGVGTILTVLFVIVSAVCAYLLGLFDRQKKKPRKEQKINPSCDELYCAFSELNSKMR